MGEHTRSETALLLSEAVMAIKIGERGLAKTLLATILQSDPNHEQALLWSAALADSPSDAVRILERILEINPRNEQARNTVNVLKLNAMTSDESRGVESPAVEAQNLPLQPQSPSRAWVCPLCDHQDVGLPIRCQRCGAILEVNDLKAISENDSVHENLLLGGVQRWEQAERHSRSFDGQINLARAYLNLHRSNDALIHLRRAIEIRPEEHKIRRALEQLKNRKLVLAVDDSMTIRRIVSILLERNGYRAAIACDGEEAMSKVREEVPDLVLLDVVMPGLNGYQVCRLLRQDERSAKVPIVILSSSLLDRIKGRLAGVTDYMAKPFETETLLKTLKKHLPPSDF
jgi:twitching motility two-component system response regulator PilG